MSPWPGRLLLREENCGDCSAAAMFRRRPSLNGICEFGIIFFACVRLEKQPSAHGEMAEWLKAHAWKACLGETLTRVRIPLSPPFKCLSPPCQIKGSNGSQRACAGHLSVVPIG